MPISRPKRPALIVSGTVLTVTPRYVFDDERRTYTDEVSAFDVTLAQQSGATLDVRFRVDQKTKALAAELPLVASSVAFVVDVQESKEWGASLVFARPVTHDDLEAVSRNITADAVPAKG
jgi:hypothetical protein